MPEPLVPDAGTLTLRLGLVTLRHEEFPFFACSAHAANEILELAMSSLATLASYVVTKFMQFGLHSKCVC
jgi:hypothetical protein